MESAETKDELDELDDLENNQDPAPAGPDMIPDEDMPKILYGIKAVRAVDWPADPRRKVYIRALSREEMFQGISEARAYTEELGLTDQVYEVVKKDDGSDKAITCLDMAMRDEWVCIAVCKDRECRIPVFDNAKHMRKRLTSEEINRLYAVLAEHMAKVTPLTYAEKLARDGAYEELVETLKKKPGEIPLASLPRDILEDCLRFMIVKSST